MTLNRFLIMLFLCTVSYLHPHISPDLFIKFHNHYLVETGTYSGNGVLYALMADFPEIYSIEIDNILAANAQDRFKNFKNVQIISGDSGCVLWDVIKEMTQPITFWLDGHNSSGIPLAKNTPLLDELEQIKLHPIKTHTILIDDLRLLGTWQFDFITKEMLIQKVLEINPDYVITYLDGYCKDDIMVARVNAAQS